MLSNKNNKRNKRVTVNLKQDEYNQLKVAALRDGLSLSRLIAYQSTHYKDGD